MKMANKTYPQNNNYDKGFENVFPNRDIMNKSPSLTDSRNIATLNFNELIKRTETGGCDIRKIKRRINHWIFNYAHDEEIYEIAAFYNIKTN